MAVNVDIPGLLKDLRNPTGVIVVPVTQHEDIGLAQVDAKYSGVVFQRVFLPRVEKDTHVFAFYPQRQAMLGNKPFTGLIVDQNRNLCLGGRH
jgi:hypothetical protein